MEIRDLVGIECDALETPVVKQLQLVSRSDQQENHMCFVLRKPGLDSLYRPDSQS